MSPLLLLTAALAQTPTVEWVGYLDSRTTWQDTDVDGQPLFSELLEGNLRLRARPTERFGADADLSLVWQGAFGIVGGARDLPQYRPAAVVSEAYLSASPHDRLGFTLGRKRVVWGSGMAFNPTDVLNPPKDPTDPASQRAGAWLLRAEVPLERVTFTVLGAAQVTREAAGMPIALGVYPDYPQVSAPLEPRDDEVHLLAAARLYALIADTDVNLIFTYSHLYQDAFRRKPRLGFSLSRTFEALEVHAEGMAMTGSGRLYADPGCTDAPMLCVLAGRAPVSYAQLDDPRWRPRLLLGARYLFEDSAQLSLEYQWAADGYTPSELAALISLVRQVPNLMNAAQQQGGGSGSPVRFRFEPLRRHHLAVSYLRSQIFDDFAVSATLLVGLEDLSGQLVPQLSWTPQEWLQLTAAVFVPLAGVESLGVDVNGERVTETGLSPIGARAFLSARVFY
jgi:hypothetical protein